MSLDFCHLGSIKELFALWRNYHINSFEMVINKGIYFLFYSQQEELMVQNFFAQLSFETKEVWTYGTKLWVLFNYLPLQ